MFQLPHFFPVRYGNDRKHVAGNESVVPGKSSACSVGGTSRGVGYFLVSDERTGMRVITWDC